MSSQAAHPGNRQRRPKNSLFESPASCYTSGMEKDFKAIIMHGFSDEQALSVMRAVKALGLGAGSTAFAMTTPTSVEWKVSDLIEHLAEEHAMMAERMKRP